MGTGRKEDCSKKDFYAQKIEHHAAAAPSLPNPGSRQHCLIRSVVAAIKHFFSITDALAKEARMSISGKKI